MEGVKKKCRYPNGIDVEVVSTRGSLSLGWKDGLMVNLRSFSASHIDVVIINGDDEDHW